MREKFWMWAFAEDGKVNGITDHFCTLQQSAKYLGFPNAVFLGTFYNLPNVREQLKKMNPFRKIMCLVRPGQAGIASAEEISKLSLEFPQITGAVIDDFNQVPPSRNIPPEKKFPTPEQVALLKENLRKHNPALELFVVQYADQAHNPLEPYLPYIDGIMMWRWVSTESFWKADFFPLIHKLKINTGKKIFQGLYLQNYGESYDVPSPVPFDLWKLQWTRTLTVMLDDLEFLDGCVLLQNGRMNQLRYRDHVIWLKETLDWLFETWNEQK